MLIAPARFREVEGVSPWVRVTVPFVSSFKQLLTRLILSPMYIIEVNLKFTPMPLSVQRKEEADAKAVYEAVLGAMETGTPKILKLTCEHQADKQLAVVSSEIASAQLYEKSGSAMTGKRPGFVFAE